MRQKAKHKHENITANGGGRGNRRKRNYTCIVYECDERESQ